MRSRMVSWGKAGIFLLWAGSLLLLFSCTNKGPDLIISAQNTLDLTRQNETIELQWPQVDSFFGGIRPTRLGIVDEQTGIQVVHQAIDEDQDGNYDLLIFQTTFEPLATKSFKISRQARASGEDVEPLVYGRFVPEREDDFAWENDQIAYRMYGPALGETGTVSSGIDVWTKSVKYLIIDKWYANGEDSYHEDHGEGLDFYKVGNSRGCGGLGIWQDGRMYTSHTFDSWKIIAEGPIRFICELSYATWSLGSNEISEVKRISLDAGQNLNRMESIFRYKRVVEKLRFAAGLAIHEEQGIGELVADQEAGCISFWEPGTEGNGHLGTGIIMDPKKIVDVTTDAGHHLVVSKTTDLMMKAVYYAGAGWDKSGDFPDAKTWHTYVAEFALRLANPIEVAIKTIPAGNELQ
ncbi:DUF4861 domain-containing protein [Candidatus Neomarinimicrobiota bacterium]